MLLKSYGSSAISLTRRLVSSCPRLLLIILMLVNFVYFGRYAAQRHLAFETGAFDVGVYAQPLWNFIQGRDFAVSLIQDNGPLRWATHVEPILFFIVPLYKLWPDPRTLLWLQVAGLTLAAWPLYALAVRRLRNEWTALAIVVAFFLMPATESVTLFDFHAVSLAPLFLLSAVYFLDLALAAQGTSLWLWPEVKRNNNVEQANSLSYKGGYVLSALFFLLALSTKEDIPLYVLMVGLYLLLLRRRWWEGSILIIVAGAWFYVASQIIIPAYRSGGGQSIYLAWFETLGDTPLEIVLSPLTKPDKVLALLIDPAKLPGLAMLTVPLALLPVLGLPFLAMAAPGFVQFLLSQNPTLRQLETWHYAAPSLAFVMLATIDGLARAVWLGQVLSVKYQVSSVKCQVSGVRCQVSRFTSPARGTPPKARKRAKAGRRRHASERHASRFILPSLTLLLLLTALIYHYLRGYSPLAKLYRWPEVTRHHQLGRALAATIPANSSVLAQAQLVPYVAHRYQLAIWNGPLSTDYDYIWLDLSHPKFPNRFNAHGELLTGLVIEERFGPVAANDGYLLLEKGAERVPLSDELFSFTQFDQLPSGSQSFKATFGDTLELIGVKPEIYRLATSETEPQVVLFFETLQKPSQDYHLFVYLLDQTGTIAGATDYPQPALFWWPTSRWQAGDRRQVRVNTIPWWTGDKTIFGYALGLSRSDDPWDAAARLPITLVGPSDNPPGSQPIDNGTLLPIAAFRRFAGLPYPKPLTILQE